MEHTWLIDVRNGCWSFKLLDSSKWFQPIKRNISFCSKIYIGLTCQKKNESENLYHTFIVLLFFRCNHCGMNGCSLVSVFFFVVVVVVLTGQFFFVIVKNYSDHADKKQQQKILNTHV